MELTATPTYRNPLETEQPVRQIFLFRTLFKGRRYVVFWSLQTLFWSTIALTGLLMTMAFRSAIPDVGWAVSMRVASGFVLTVGLREIYRHSGIQQRRGLVKWPLVAGCCVAVALLEFCMLQAVMATGISLPGGAETFGLKLLFVRFFTVSLWSALYFGFHLLEDEHAMELRATQAELIAREHELRHLQAQMSPHFLFNALNAVLACKDDPDAVREVTASLSDYLKFLLQETRPLEPLAQELDALEKFLTVQTSHVSRNLVCRIQCDPEARKAMVPPMLIQPLLENAFQCRPPTHDQPLHIWITARVEKGSLRVTMSHTGEWSPDDGKQEPGNGISALRQRLHLLLGPQAGVEQQTDNGWSRFTIQIPLTGPV